jgi:hypothetical protein
VVFSSIFGLNDGGLNKAWPLKNNGNNEINGNQVTKFADSFTSDGELVGK